MTREYGRHVGALLARGEGKTLEFKRDLSSPRNILRTVCAFANSAGGVIVIGIDDAQAVLGIEHPLDEEERLCNIIADGIEPVVVPHVDMLNARGRSLLRVEVFPSPSRPHRVIGDGHRGVYVRLGSTNRSADADLVEELRRAATGATYDEQPLPACGVGDLDVAALSEDLPPRGRRAEGASLSVRDMESLRIVVRHQRRHVATVGGALLCCRRRQTLYPDAWVQCGRFAGHDRSYIIDHVDIHAPLHHSVEAVMDFLRKHALRGADLSQVRRRDVWSIPLGMLREAVVNAIVHADYSQKGAPIRVAYFDDRIEIENPGILLPGLTVADLEEGVSRLRNRVIGRVFRELGLVEQWGSGVPRMRAEAAQLGLPAPSIEEIGMRCRVTVHLQKDDEVRRTAQPRAIRERTRTLQTALRQESQPESRQEMRQESRQETQLASRLESPLAARIVLALRQGTAGRRDLARYVGHASVSGELNRQIRRLLDLGLIEMTRPEVPNSRLQQYRLTRRGRALT